MKTFTLILATVFTFFVSFSFAQEKAYLILDENNGQYDVFLKIDNAKKLTSVSVEGYFSTQSKIDDISVNITNNKDLAKFKENVALIHRLDAEVVAATYQVKIEDREGNVITMPVVVVNLDDYNNLASNF